MNCCCHAFKNTREVPVTLAQHVNSPFNRRVVSYGRPGSGCQTFYFYIVLSHAQWVEQEYGGGGEFWVEGGFCGSVGLGFGGEGSWLLYLRSKMSNA